MTITRIRNKVLKLLISLSAITHGIILVEGSWATSRHVDSYLASPRVTSWGQWGSWAFCHPGDYVVGVQLRVESSQGNGDDSGLNAIRLLCESLNGRSSYWIRSKEGEWGDWKSSSRCPDVATGFELRSEPQQGGGDDVAASNFRLYCTGPSGGFYRGEASTLDWGYWSGLQKCPSGHAICGIQTQEESPVGRDDDTSLNNVDIACCKIEHPTTACTPGFNWRTLTSCSGDVCSASYTAGLAYNSDKSGNVSPSTSFYEYFNMKLQDAYVSLAQKFKAKFPHRRDLDELINSKTAESRQMKPSFLDCTTGIEVLEMTCGMYTLTSPVEHRCRN